MDHTRHIDIYDVSNVTVTLIGVGGIGATTAIALAKMGVMSLMIYDMDRVGTENLTTQLHKLSDVGRFKADAMKNEITEYASDVWVEPRAQQVTEMTTFDTDFVICAVDNIKTRKDVWSSVQNSSVQFFIDARMSAEEFHLYSVDLKNQDAVNLYTQMIIKENDELIPDLPCTMKATIYCAFMAAGHVSNSVKKLAMGEGHPFSIIHNIKTHTFLFKHAVSPIELLMR